MSIDLTNEQARVLMDYGRMKRAKPLYGASGGGLKTLLDRLEHVRSTGEGRYRAKCPVHGGDSHNSMGIRECEDGKILLRCYAYDCPAAEIIATVGMCMSDLFPARLEDHKYRHNPIKWHEDAQHKDWAEAARKLLQEARVVWVAGHAIHNGEVLKQGDLDRLKQALNIIERHGRNLNAYA